MRIELPYANKPGIQAPSQTARGDAWLTNFARLEVPYATLLIDSLTIVSTSKIRTALRIKLHELHAKNEIEFPALLLVPRKMNEYTRIGNTSDSVSVAYDSFFPGESMPATPGSEAMLGSLIRDLAGNAPNVAGTWLHPESDIELLCDARCRSIVLVSDYSGSGTQIVRFAESLLRNKTIRSWHSYGLVKIFALVYASAPAGASAMHACKSITASWFIDPAADFATATWSETERQQIVNLCRSKAKKNPDFRPLGFKNSAGLFATESTIPNNLPSVLGQKVEGWKPFFDGRVMPADLLGSVVGYEPEPRRELLLEGLNQERLRNNWKAWSTEDLSQLTILILARGLRKGSTDWELSLELRTPEEAIARVTTFLKKNNFVDTHGRTTPLGIAEIAAAKRKNRKIETELLQDDVMYYPSTLR